MFLGPSVTKLQDFVQIICKLKDATLKLQIANTHLPALQKDNKFFEKYEVSIGLFWASKNMI